MPAVLPAKRRVLLAAALLLLALGAAGLALLRRLDRAIERDASVERWRQKRVRPLEFVAAARRPATPMWGDGTVSSVAAAAGMLWSGGGSGLTDGTRVFDAASGLPSLRVEAVASWRGIPVFALERGGWGRVDESGVRLARSGWGELQVRALLETEGGELLIGARQGLFRVAWGTSELERLDSEPVRALALGPSGEVLAGGERGLRVVSLHGEARRVETPDPWVDSVGWDGDTLWAATAAGIATGRSRAASLELHRAGADLTGGVLLRQTFTALPADGTPRVVTLRGDGARAETATPERFRALLSAGGELLADGPSGLWRRDRELGWRLLRRRPAGALPHAHVNAVAAQETILWAGFFDGGIARKEALSPVWENVEGGAWGVNALLPAGGALYAATLRGAFRVDHGRAVELPGAGGAFALASTGSGIAVGYGQGVLLPEQRLLSAFHGLPGNQAYALAMAPAREALWVGTPSGLGRVERRRVVFRTTTGEGKLPHPWVTGLLDRGDALYVATYGGGVAKRTGDGEAERWERFVETEGLKVNAGALVADGNGRLWIGTQGRGLWRSDTGVTRFERVDVPLPSPDVFSLAVVTPEKALYAGTAEGLARISTEESETP